MRLSSLLFGKSYRLPNNDPVPFKDMMPLALKNRVSNKSYKKSGENCLFEMSLLMACLKDNEYQDKLCHQEAENFQKCYDNYLSKKHAEKKLQEKTEITPGSSSFTSKQINNLLRKYPNT